jgi:hypothetical protein
MSCDTAFRELVRIMVDADLELAWREKATGTVPRLSEGAARLV